MEKTVNPHQVSEMVCQNCTKLNLNYPGESKLFHEFFLSDESPDQPMEEQNIQGVLDSQDIVMPFSLHLTQSQLVMGSQMPSDTSQGLEGIQEVKQHRE